MNPLQQLSDANGQPAFALPANANTHVERITTVAATSQTVAIPSGAKFAFFSFPEDVYVSYDGTDAERSGASTSNGSGSELNPAVRDIRDAPDLRVITQNAVTGSITFYS